MGSFLQSLGAFLLVLTPVMFVHELGHFLVARWCGVRVQKFSIGFGPRIFSFERKGVVYQAAWIPLLAFVDLAGFSPESPSRKGEPDEFLSQVWWKKAAIAVAGPAMNLVLAFFILFGVYNIGARFEDWPAVAGRMPADSYAQKIGLQPGDRMTALDGREVKSWMGFYMALTDAESARHPQHRLDYLRGSDGGPLQPGTVTFPDKRLSDFLSGFSVFHPPVIGSVLVGGAAYLAGLKDGDRIESVNGKPVREWTDLTDFIFVNSGKPLHFQIRRGDRQLSLTITPQAQEEGPRGGRIGVAPQSTGFYHSKPAPPLKALEAAWTSTWMIAGQTFSGLVRLVRHPAQISQQVGGPILIGQLAGVQARRGVSDFLWFVAFINIAIMAFQLLPIPGLDGAHTVLAMLEGILRRPFPDRQLVWLYRAAFVTMGVLILFVVGNDTWRTGQRMWNTHSGESRGHTESRAPAAPQAP
jgi:regulator of sigma E protease